MTGPTSSRSCSTAALPYSRISPATSNVSVQKIAPMDALPAESYRQSRHRPIRVATGGIDVDFKPLPFLSRPQGDIAIAP